MPGSLYGGFRAYFERELAAQDTVDSARQRSLTVSTRLRPLYDILKLKPKPFSSTTLPVCIHQTAEELFQQKVSRGLHY